MKNNILSASEYQSLYGIKKIVQKTPCGVKKGRSSLSDPPISDSIHIIEGWVKITLVGLIHGLNGSKGLMQSNFYTSNKEKKKIELRIKALNPPEFNGKVMIIYTRYGSKLMDWDNMCSTAKFPFDGLKNNKVIVDDSPEYIVQFVPKQVKCRRKDQRTEITITNI